MDWGLWIYSFNKHQRLFLSTLNSETHCFNCAGPHQRRKGLNCIVFPTPLGWKQLLTWENGAWGVDMANPVPQCTWHPAGLGEATAGTLHGSESTTHLGSGKAPRSNQQTQIWKWERTPNNPDSLSMGKLASSGKGKNLITIYKSFLAEVHSESQPMLECNSFPMPVHRSQPHLPYRWGARDPGRTRG